MQYYNRPTFEPTEQQINNAQCNAVRRASNVWGFAAAFGNLAISFIVMFVYEIAERLDYNITAPIPELVLQIVLSTALMTVPFIIGALSSGQKISPLIEIHKVPAGLFFPLIMVGLGGAMVINNMTGTFISLINSFGLEPSAGELPLPDSLGGVLLFIFAVSVVPAIVEEFAYRGIVLGALRRYGDGFAIIASSVLFGLMHGNLVQIPFAFALGCVMGYINVVTGSILPSVIVHFFNNLLSCIQQIASTHYGEDVGIITIVASYCIALTLGILGLALLCRRYKHPFSPLREKCAIPLKNSLKGFLTCPGTIVSYIIFGGSAIVSILLPYISSYIIGE